MIFLKNIKKSYGDRIVLDDLTMHFEGGSITVIKGVSGCGKTTLLNVIGGIIKDFTGEYTIHGVDSKVAMKKGFKDTIAYVFQQSLLFQHFDVWHNLTFILNDEDKILHYAKMFNVEHLLHKKVQEISNGERQRISIIRALLIEPQILLCDEPSASLDSVQSESLAKELAQLKALHKTVIIVTHEHSFDGIADRIVHIHYGKIISVEERKKEEQVVHYTVKSEPQKRKSYLKNDIQFAVQRSKKTKLIVNICFIIIFLSSLFSTALSLHFSSNYKGYIYESYPYHMISLKKKSLERLHSKDYNLKYKVYEDVEYRLHNTIIYPLYAYKDSAFRIPKAIDIGTFAQKENEILVNEQYVTNVLKLNDATDAIGSVVYVKDQPYKITGVLTNNKNIMKKIAKNNAYKRDFNVPLVFMKYDELRKIGTILPNIQVMASVQNIPPGSSNFQFISDNFKFIWLSEVEVRVATIVFFMKIFFVSLSSLAIIIFLFSINLIYLSLYYRKKEFGFLQLFSVTKKRVRRIVFIEYFMKVALAILVSDALYVIIGILIKKEIGFMFWLNIQEIIVLHIILIGYIYVLTYIPLYRILRKPIIKLIQDS